MDTVAMVAATAPQIIIAPVITPHGFPLAYEVIEGNTADCTTLRGFLDKIETL